MKLDFYRSNYGEDFECVCDWPSDWPHNIEYDDGSINYELCDIWFKAYDTTLLENDEDIRLFENGYLFNCQVRTRYCTSGLYYEDSLAKFAAKDKDEAERLLQIAANAIYD